MAGSTATEATLERMLALFDVAPLGPDCFAGESDAGGHAGRHVVEGSQILAQAMVAAGKALSGKALSDKTRPGRATGWTVRSTAYDDCWNLGAAGTPPRTWCSPSTLH